MEKINLNPKNFNFFSQQLKTSTDDIININQLDTKISEADFKVENIISELFEFTGEKFKGKKQNKGTELLIMNYEIPNFTKFEVSIDNEHENSQLSLDI